MYLLPASFKPAHPYPLLLHTLWPCPRLKFIRQEKYLNLIIARAVTENSGQLARIAARKVKKSTRNLAITEL
jgi:hypothetical protein